jgi:GNAT superfamily N-acetyltransferase
MEIRTAGADDLYGLVQALGQWHFYIDRLNRQQAGRGELITAWSAGQALGAVYLWLEEADEPEIRRYLPEVPLLTHLQVASSHRNRRVGTHLIAATERRALELGHDRLALAVRLGNHHAERLYQRLGYRRWPYGLVECEDKFGDLEIEVCDILVKTLAGGIVVPAQRSGPMAFRSGSRVQRSS